MLLKDTWDIRFPLPPSGAPGDTGRAGGGPSDLRKNYPAVKSRTSHGRVQSTDAEGP